VRVLVTGSEGYIGTRLGPWLSARGHEIVGLDTGYYRDCLLYPDPERPPPTLRKDLRTVTPADFEGVDAVVHLAELVGDPLSQLRPAATMRINHEGSVRVARAARAAGVRRLVYASSCSVYGRRAADVVDEASPVDPQSPYARCKVLAERDLTPMAGPDFAVVFLRNATAYGASPRMRFDIVLNDLCALAWTTKNIALISDGSHWRPIVHVEDICEAVRCALEAPAEAVNGEVFNVGATAENYRIAGIAEIVASEFPDCIVTMGKPSGDNRSYRVSFEKIATRLPGFTARWTAQAGAAELHRLFARIALTADTAALRAYSRLKQMSHLHRTGQVDDDLRWTAR
jgi:nucleoside-diphosphate-sugar epimerase